MEEPAARGLFVPASRKCDSSRSGGELRMSLALSYLSAMFRLCPCTSAVGLLRSSFCKSSPKNSHKWTSQFLPTSFSDGNSSMRQHTEPLGSPQEAKGCDQILASGSSAWHHPGGTSSLAQSLAQSSNQCSR